MKLAIVSTGLGHVARGIETWAQDSAAALHRRGLDVTLFKGSGSSTRPYERVVTRCIPRNSRRGITLDRLMPAGAWRWGFGSAYQIEQTTFGWGVIPMLEAGRFDVVHLQDPWLAQTLRRRGFRVIYMNGTEESLDFIRQFSFVQEQSPYYAQRHGSPTGPRVFMIPSFVDVERFCPGDQAAARKKFGLPEKAFLVLSVGALRRTRKRMDWMVQEFVPVDGTLVLAGAREAESAEFVAAARQRLGDRLIVLENVPHTEMPDLYRAADVFALCSLEEIFGLAFVEAMACGVPCVGHCFPVTEWLIGPGGKCVDLQVPGALTAALPQVRGRGHLARKWVEENFSVDRVVTQMIEMYRTVVTV